MMKMRKITTLFFYGVIQSFLFRGECGVIPEKTLNTISNGDSNYSEGSRVVKLPCTNDYQYNKKYPLSEYLKTATDITYKIAIISDLDRDTRDVTNGSWLSYYKQGKLKWQLSSNKISIEWDKKDVVFSTKLAWDQRGMELSELVTFDGKILSFDDKTGVIFSIEGNKAYPWVILADGNGKDENGFKSEWALVKNEMLYVGSHGKEWTTPNGEIINYNPMWIKVVSPKGEVKSQDWSENYNQLRKAMNIDFPGYVTHEAAGWSETMKKWFFLPRRCSRELYNENDDGKMGCNVLLIADENFSSVTATKIGTLEPLRGFSSFKFLPGSEDQIIIALKTEEYEGKTSTYVTAFTIEGIILMPDTKITDKKFEGLEFV